MSWISQSGATQGSHPCCLVVPHIHHGDPTPNLPHSTSLVLSLLDSCAWRVHVHYSSLPVSTGAPSGTARTPCHEFTCMEKRVAMTTGTTRPL